MAGTDVTDIAASAGAASASGSVATTVPAKGGVDEIKQITIETLRGDTALVRLASGEVIDATPVNLGVVGARTNVSIRPERVEFKPELMPAGGHGLDAEVLEVIYMGDILRTRMRVPGSESFVMKSRNTVGQTRLEPGQRIKIGWHKQDARALDPV